MQNENGSPKKSLLSAQVDLSKFDSSYFRAATEEEKKQQDVMSESTTFFKDGIRRLKKNPLAMGSLVVLILILLIIIIAPHIVPYSYDQIITVNGVRDKSAKNLGMMEYSPRELQYMEETGEKLFPHIFGTDSLCRDYFIRVIYGTRVSLAVGLVASIMVLIIGLLYGAIAGYCGGKVDMVMQRILEIANGIPRLVIVTLLLLVLKPGMLTIIFALMLTEWVGMSRIARAEMLKLKEQEFVLASRTLGAGSFFIIFKEILPNIIGPIITQVMFSIPTAIFTEAFLSFVGLGIPVPQCSLGSLISEGFNSFTTHSYQIIPPIIVMALLMLSFNLVADGLREALDPKMKEM